MTANEQRMGRWLGAILGSSGLPPDEPLTVLLVHAAVDQSQRTVRSWRLPTEQSALATTIAEINEEAEEDATQMGGMQRYFLRALAKSKEVGSIAVRYNADADHMMPAVDSEPASARGLVSQAQRFAEAVMRIFVQGHGQIIENQSRMSATQQTMIDMFQKQQIEVLNMQQKLAGQSVEHELRFEKERNQQELALMKEQENQKRINEGASTLIKYAPHVLHYLTKGKTPILPTPEEEAKAKLEQMFAGMDRAAFEKWLAENVPEGEQMEVAMIYEQVHQEMTAATPTPTTDPAAADGRKRAEENVIALAEAIYAGLPTVDLTTLSPLVLAGGQWEALAPNQQAAMAQFAGAALSACKQSPAATAEDAGHWLWDAVVANAASLGSLVPAVLGGVPWGSLDRDQRFAALGIANAMLRSLGKRRGGPAAASQTPAASPR